MARYTLNRDIYVENSDNMIYKVVSYICCDGYSSLELKLRLVAGWDYINPDENDLQGYVSSDKFIEEVQADVVVQYFITESMEEALVESGYKVMRKLPKIH